MSLSLDLSDCSVLFADGNEIDIRIDNPKASVCSGNIVLLLGDNGSGKSSYMKAVSGVFRSTRFIRECSPFSVMDSGKQKQIQPNISNSGDKEIVRSGYLSQVPRANIICSSIRDEFEFSIRRSCIRNNRPTINYAIDILKNLGINEDQSPYQLSKGQQQLVGYLSITIMEPELLFLDEPTSFLDDSRTNWLLNDIMNRKCRESSITFIATHDRRVISTLMDDPGVIVLRLSCIAKQTREEQADKDILLKHKTFKYNLNSLSFSEITSHRKSRYFTLPPSKLKQGSCLSIYGSNGSGKTTLIDSLCGFHKTSSGNIYWGQGVYKPGRQFFDFFSYITQNAEDQISMYDSSKELSCTAKMNDWSECLEELLQAIYPLLGRVTWSLSYGQRKFLVACAQLCSAPVLLMDEPFASLDLNYKALLKKGVDKFLQSEGIVIIAQCNKEDVQESKQMVEIQL